MSSVYCFTCVTLCDLDRAQVLSETVKRHHPDWQLWLCVADSEPPGSCRDLISHRFHKIVSLDDFAVPNLTAWVFPRQRDELCTAAKGLMLRHLLAMGAAKVIYFDPNIALFDSVSPVVELLDSHPIVLTPRLSVSARRGPRFSQAETGASDGVYDFGFAAIAGTDAGRAFADWWSDRLSGFCHDELRAERPADRSWGDVIPALFPGTYILHDEGYNVASWNLEDRPIHITPVGDITVHGAPLRFINFAGLDAALDANSEEHLGAFELLRWYRSRLTANTIGGLTEGYWAFAQYQDGTPILPAHRIAYRKSDALQRQYPNPFASGPDSYQEWCSVNL